MRRVSTVVLALSCLAAGAAFLGTRANALEDVSPARRFPGGIGVGSRVTLWFSSDPKAVDCTIARIDAGWVLCDVPRDQMNAFTKPDEIWYDLAHVNSLTKLETKR